MAKFVSQLPKFVLSFLIVILGQPGKITFIAPIAAGVGYALFWYGLTFIESKKQRFFLSLIWFFGVQAVWLSWMLSTQYVGFMIVFAYLGLCLGMGAQFAILSYFIPPKSVFHALVLSGLGVLLEWSRLFFLCGFTWNPVGMALSATLPSLQFANIGGIFFLSFWVFFTNFLFLLRKKKVLLFVGCALLPYIYGLFFIIGERKEEETMRVALVQTGLYPDQKVPMYSNPKAFVPPLDQWNTIFTMLRNQKNQYDLIILPEAALPFTIDALLYPLDLVNHYVAPEYHPPHAPHLVEGPLVTNRFIAHCLSNEFNAEVISGFDSHDHWNNQSYNSAFFFSPQKTDSIRYEKQILLPLAEYLPLSWLTPLAKKFGITNFFTPGEKSTIFRGKKAMSTSICYEETFSNLIREGKKGGAEILVNLTNDGWYPHSHLPAQHFYHARVRSVENGLPLLRSCNTGITAAFDSRGRIVGTLTDPHNNDETLADVLVLNLPLMTHRTLYSIWGNWAIVILSFLLFLAGIIKPRILRLL